MLKKFIIFLSMGMILLLTGCATEHKVQVEPVEVKPIHITIDVNIRVDRALDNFFDEIDKAAQEVETETATEADEKSAP